MLNPWLNYSFESSAIHSKDSDLISQFNAKAKSEFKYSDVLLPDPYIGSLNSKLMLLALNPGLSENDFYVHKDNNYIKHHYKNINQTETEYPFYYLNPNLHCPGSDWWHKKLKWIIGDLDLKNIASKICCLQLTPYHSVKFKKSSKLLHTQNFIAHTLKNHIKNGYPIVIMRSKKHWVELVPELESYPNAFLLKNPRNPTLSPNNIGKENYLKILGILGKKI
jgi:hypothetical protein